MNFWKRKLTLLRVGVLTLGLTLLASTPVLADPVAITLLTNPDNHHNMSNWATHDGAKAAMTDGTDQICIFCHTPHAAEPVDAPLWNRTQPIGSFSLYGGTLAIKDGSTIQNAAQYGSSYGDYPNGSSRLCMSCHDGVTAVGVGLLRNGGDIAMTSTHLDADGSLQDALGSVIDLSTSHPISFIYTDAVAALVDGYYGGSAYQGPAAFSSTVNSPLDSQSRMQCTTCHDPHYDTKLNNAALPPFWQNPSSTSPYDDVCAQCHIGGTPTGPTGDHTAPGI